MTAALLRHGLLALALALTGTASYAQRVAAKPQPLKSGLEFTGAEVRELQHDDFANPGMLWVTRGESLWQEPAGRDGKSCAGCHGDAKTAMQGVDALPAHRRWCRTVDQP